MGDLAVLLRAVAFSAARHRNQRRKGAEAFPYINHPVEVAEMLASVGGVTDLDTLIAAILHDTIEDTETSREEIEAIFGQRVRAIVEEVTDDKRLPQILRKKLQVQHAPGLSDPAKLIKIADKMSNIQELMQSPPQNWSVQRKQEYLDWAWSVFDGCRGVNEALEHKFEEVIRQARLAFSDDA
jgi:guanosine-3',5'-bis(diphosphate) 3'-pyrophosphohydrolase